MPGRIDVLKQRMGDIQTALSAYMDRYNKTPDMELTKEDREAINNLNEEYEKISAEVGVLETAQARISSATAPAPRQTQPEPVGDSTIMDRGAPMVSRRTQFENSGTHGFKNQGEFTQAVIRAAVSPANVDERLNIGQVYRGEGGMREEVGSDGGFLVPPDFRTSIMTKVAGEDTILGRTDGLTTGSNAITVPVDEVTPWDDSRGVQAYWDGEGHEKTESKGELAQTQVRLNKLTALIRLTDELMEDAVGLQSYLNRKVPEKFDHKVNMGLVHGTGVGMPLGILNSDFTVVTPSSTGAAAIAEFADLVAMWARMYAPWRASAVWHIHPQIEERLPQIAFDPNATAGHVPVYLPANSISGTPYSTLFGRPVIPTEVCAAPSDPGDIIFASWGQYMSATKGGGVRSDTSIHVFFKTDETALRFVLRIGGQPWYKEQIAARAGTFPRSAFTILADRT